MSQKLKWSGRKATGTSLWMLSSEVAPRRVVGDSEFPPRQGAGGSH